VNFPKFQETHQNHTTCRFEAHPEVAGQAQILEAAEVEEASEDVAGVALEVRPCAQKFWKMQETDRN
jgi:hypothetical protein